MVVTGHPVIELLDVTPGIAPGTALGVLLGDEPVAAPTPAPIVEPCVALGVAPVLYERMQQFNFYRAILPTW
jgi:hypothetical protein